MSIDISLVGMRLCAFLQRPEWMPPELYNRLTGSWPIPAVEVECPEVGFTNLLWTLEDLLDEASTGYLVEVTCEEPGFRRIYIHDAARFLQHVRENPGHWDDVGIGFQAALQEVEEHPDLHWWFHVKF